MILSKTSNALLDVIIPFKDNFKFFPTCLRSVLMQSFDDFNVYVIDNGSCNHESRCLHQFIDECGDFRVKLIKRADPLGPSGARNVGIRMGSAPFIAFLDADDAWFSEKLVRQVEILHSLPETYVAIYCGYDHIDSNDLWAGKALVEPRVKGDVYFDLLKGGNLISGSCSSALVRRDALKKVGLFDESLKFGEDWDLFLRLARLGRFDYVDKVLCSIRLHEDSLQAIARRAQENLEILSVLRILEKNDAQNVNSLIVDYSRMVQRHARRNLTFGQLEALRIVLRDIGPLGRQISDVLSPLKMVRGLLRILLRSVIAELRPVPALRN